MKINIVHALPESASAFGKDEDGLSAAVEMIQSEHEVRWVNVHPANSDHKEHRRRMADADFVLVRSDWGWFPDAAAGPLLSRGDVPCGLLIAGSSPPPSAVQALRYDVLFYETPWYEQFLPQRPRALLGFGVDTRVMQNYALPERDIDWLMVGRLAEFKRPLRLLEKRGKRVAVGDFASANAQIYERLGAGGVSLLDHMTQRDLAALYNRAKTVLVPCRLQGGGERAVIEGLACGCEVEIADDNPKLASLLETRVRSHVDYAGALMEGITGVLSGDKTEAWEKRRGERQRLAHVMRDKLRRSPSTIRIRARNAARRLWHRGA